VILIEPDSGDKKNNCVAEKAPRTMPGWINSQLLLSHACSTAAYHANFLLSGRKIHSLTGQRMQPARRSWPVQSQAFQAVGPVRDFLQTPFFLHLSQRSSGSVNTQQYANSMPPFLSQKRIQAVLALGCIPISHRFEGTIGTNAPSVVSIAISSISLDDRGHH
jgi:hypothetical protein